MCLYWCVYVFFFFIFTVEGVVLGNSVYCRFGDIFLRFEGFYNFVINEFLVKIEMVKFWLLVLFFFIFFM